MTPRIGGGMSDYPEQVLPLMIENLRRSPGCGDGGADPSLRYVTESLELGPRLKTRSTPNGRNGQ
jgi:hypothetical protein